MIHRAVCVQRSDIDEREDLFVICVYHHNRQYQSFPLLSYFPVFALQWRHNMRDGVSNHQPHDCLLKHLFGRRKKTPSKLRVTGLCAGNSPVTGEFPAQMTSNAENVPIWWRHYDMSEVVVRNRLLIKNNASSSFCQLNESQESWHFVSVTDIYKYSCILWSDGIFICLLIIPSDNHHYAELFESIAHTKCFFVYSVECVSNSMSILSIIFYVTSGPVSYQLIHVSFDITSIVLLHFIIIITLKIWIAFVCLGPSHEPMFAECHHVFLIMHLNKNRCKSRAYTI